jgi:ATP-dependent DNA helicase DinG
VGGSFEFFRNRLGMKDGETMIVESPFDHARQAILYLPKRMPEPREPGFFARGMEEIEALLDITQGRAFLLFTSHAALGRATEHLERVGRWPLLVQGEGSKVALVERFKTTPRAVLLGTSSFWHGVDVPGEALSLVVIDKLPFDVPSDPLVAARIERIRENEGNPFAEYQTPMAVLDLKQGLGRLLRSRGDRGILAVLDPRLTTKGYGKTFLASLPPYPIVRDRTAAENFFKTA